MSHGEVKVTFISDSQICSTLKPFCLAVKIYNSFLPTCLPPRETVRTEQKTTLRASAEQDARPHME